VNTARSELRTGALVTGCLMAAGVLVAVVWWLIAPLPRLEVHANGVFFAPANDEYAVAADGWFAVCTATAGLVAALVVYARARFARLGGVLGLAVGGLLASIVVWRLGMLLGPGDALETAKGLPVGRRFDGPLELSALGVLFSWPIAAVVAYFALTAGLEPSPSPRSDVDVAPGPPFPVTVLRPGYAITEVDDLFRRLEAGEIRVDSARELDFSPTRWRRGYDGASVEAAIEARAGAVAGLSGPGLSRPETAGGSVPPSPQ
jgi:hypothetical protein